MRIRFRPRVVADVALATAVYLLADDPPARIALSWFGAGWLDEIYGSWKAAVQRMADLTIKARALQSDAFRLRERNISRLSAGDPLGELFARWRSHRGHFDAAIFTPLIQGKLQDRYATVTSHSSNPTLTFASIGTGFLSYNKAWRRAVRGRRMEDQPDVLYGTWAANAYREALASGEPRLDDVDALINRPGLGSHRVRYRRLIVPFRPYSGVTYLLGASLIDPSVDLRVEG